MPVDDILLRALLLCAIEELDAAKEAGSDAECVAHLKQSDQYSGMARLKLSAMIKDVGG